MTRYGDVLVRPWAAIIAGLIVAASASAAAPALAAETAPLTFLCDRSYPPMTYLDAGQPKGVVVDILRALGTRIGRPIDIRAIDWREAQGLVAGGKADALCQMSVTEARKKIFDFSDSMLVSTFSIFVHAGRFGFSELADLRGSKVGVTAGGLPRTLVEADPQIAMTIVDDYLQGFRMVEDGRLDAIVADNWVGTYLLAQDGLSDVQVSGDPVARLESSIAVRKGNQPLLAVLDKGLASLKADGTLARISAQWQPKEVIFQTREQAIHETYLIALSVLAVLLVIAIIWMVTLTILNRRLKRAEGAVGESEARFRVMIERAPEAIIVYDADLKRIVDANAAAERLFNCAREELLKGGLDRLYPAAQSDGKPVSQSIDDNNARALAGEEVVFERVIRHADGRERLCEVRVVRLPYGDRRLLRGSYIDITERRRMGEELRESRDSLVQAQRIGQVGSSEVDLRTDTSVWSEELLRIYGIDESSKPRSFEEYLKLLHPDDRDAYRATRAHDLSEESVEPVEYRIVRPDGEIRWVRDHRGVVRDASGTPIKLIGLQQDITDERHADDELRRSRENLVAAQRIGRIGSAEIDLDSGQVENSDELSRIYGREPSDGPFPGEEFFLLVHPDDRETVRAEHALNNKGVVGDALEFRIVRPDGETRWIHREVELVKGKNGKLGKLLIVEQDITDRIRLEEEDRRHREREAQAGKVEALGNLAGGIAHDFNNLLGAVLGFGQFLVQDLPKGSDQRQFAERIVATSERGRSLVRQILAFSRRSVVEATEVRVREIIAESYDMLRATLPSTTQIVVRNAVSDATLFMDKGQLLQILVNLCVNASDALEERPGTVTVSVSEVDRNRPDIARLPVADGRRELAGIETWIDADGTGHILTGGLPRGGCIAIGVSDTGTGIPRDMLGKILEPFVTTKDAGKGTGLGLALVHRIVIDQGGALVASTREGEGTRFEILLPLSGGEAGAATEKSAAPAGETSAAASRGAKILVVDDDEAYLPMVETALRRAGHQVDSTNDPRIALEWIKREWNEWDVLFTDQTMPHLRGSDLIRSCKAISPQTLCIICTGFSSGLSEDEARVAGADGYLVKPYSVGDLAALVTRLLTREA
jgi:PAS domain S-box-containing protein